MKDNKKLTNSKLLRTGWSLHEPIKTTKVQGESATRPLDQPLLRGGTIRSPKDPCYIFSISF